MIAVVLVIQPALAVPLAPPILTAAVLLSLIALAAWRRSAKVENHALVLQDPLDLELMLGLTALLTIIMLLSKLWSSANSGLFTLGGASGLLDVDPITLSMAKLAGTSVAATTAVSTILIAAAANGVAKALMALTFGGPRLGFMLGISALAAFGVGIATYTYLTVY
jgi:hypothetical protein